jgi:hypothetical protein
MVSNLASDPMFRLPAKPVSQLLVELAALQDRARSGDPIAPPEVTLRLDSGHCLTGSILRCSEATGLVLLLAAPRDATYLPIGAIQAVTVHYSPETLHLLSDDQIRTGTVPSRLDLERQVRALSTQLSPITVTIAWDEMVTTDAAFQSLGPLIQHVQEILLDIQADSLGSAALRRLDQVAIRFGEGQIRLADRALTLGIAVVDQDLVVLPKAQLRQAIERLL